MDYKRSCVVDAEGYYKDIVRAARREVRLPPEDAAGEALTEAANEAREADIPAIPVEPVAEWVVQGYTLEDGERLVDSQTPPAKRPHAGAPGLVRPRWDDETAAWVEGATAEEIAAWEAEHPAPEPPGPTPDEQMRADIDYLAALGGVAL